jgi:hypothetical protein
LSDVFFPGRESWLIIECAPHPPFGTGTAKSAAPALVSRFEGLMADIVSRYREGATKAYQGLPRP